MSARFILVCAALATLAFPGCTGGPRADLETLKAQRDKLVYQRLAARGVSEEVQAAMAAFPRHELLPDEIAARAYEEADFYYPGSRVWVWPPALLGLALTEMNTTPGQRVLVIGAQDGWPPALLAVMGLEVVLWDPDAKHGVQVHKRLQKIETPEFDPERVRYAPSLGDALAAGPYERMFVGGAVQTIPFQWLQALEVGRGQMLVPVGVPGEMRLSVIERTGEKRVYERVLRGGTFPYLVPETVVNYAQLLMAEQRAAQAASEESRSEESESETESTTESTEETPE